MPSEASVAGVTLDRRQRPLRDLRVSVVDRCNFRCPYCMPEERYPRDASFLSSTERLAPDEIERLVRAFVGLGVTKVRLTGGEPLLRRDLPEIIERLARVDGIADLALTTNGSLLAPRAQALRQAGLHRLTVSLDTLDPAIFAKLSGGRGDVADVLRGIEAAESAGYTSIKLNTVVMRGVNETAPLALLRRFRGTGHVVRFIEYMDVGTCNGWRVDDVVTTRELAQRIDAVWPIEPIGRAQPGEVAERWRFVDGAGELGFISSVSQPFCGDCNRSRVAADGQFFTCLFASRGHDLRALLRSSASDLELAEAIAAIWSARDDRYSEIRALRSNDDSKRNSKRIEMFAIGG